MVAITITEDKTYSEFKVNFDSNHKKRVKSG